jgi:dynactin 5
MRLHKGQMTFIPMRIGDNVFIGPGCHISSASISSHVYVGAGCVLSPLCIVKEGSKILPNTVVPSGMTVPAGTVVGGRPAKILEEVGDGWGQGGGVEGDEWVEGGDLRPLVRSIK